MSIGVTVGKFNPPHLGHLYLIETAAAQVDRLYVLLGDRLDQTIPAQDRAAWLRDAAPDNATIMTTPDNLPEAAVPWAERALDLLPHQPDVAFTSEAYGPAWAEAMGARHVMVDVSRSALPITGTELRQDLAKHYRWLVPAARAALARHVTLVGAESTGKSTLTEALAAELRTVWIPEHGRWYWEGRRHLENRGWTTDEFRRIALCQQRLAADLARLADHSVVINDTDALVTSIWHQRYLGHIDAELERLAKSGLPDLYLVCAPDFAWVQDGTRESNGHRQAMHQRTLEAVAATGVPWLLLTGGPRTRLRTALGRIKDLRHFPPFI